MKTPELAIDIPAAASLSVRRGSPESIELWATAGWGLVAVAALQAAYALEYLGFLSLLYLFALIQMARARTWRYAFYSAFAVGFLIGIFQLEFFWRIFSAGAVALWMVFALWIGLFVALSRLCLQDAFAGKASAWGWFAIPFAWCGLEYFRSELYYLRFGWVTPGFAFANSPNHMLLAVAGTYGLGFLIASVACAAVALWPKSRWKATVILFLGAGALFLLSARPAAPVRSTANKAVRIAGIQMEFPSEKEVLLRLNELIRKQPESELVVLSEYTFGEPVPQSIRTWCREHRRYLIVGGKEPVNKTNFYNTAFVVSPEGSIVFRQVKSVPIQFFKDGLPAPEQHLWNSPWGKIGICICYDLSYSRVTDRLIKLGAEALIVPTMDVADWGERQHRLHARVAPVRAAEYEVPVFRLASSGISQLVDCTGRVLAQGAYPGDGAVVCGSLELQGPGSVPLDRWLARLAVAFTLAIVLSATWKKVRRKPQTS